MENRSQEVTSKEGIFFVVNSGVEDIAQEVSKNRSNLYYGKISQDTPLIFWHITNEGIPGTCMFVYQKITPSAKVKILQSFGAVRSKNILPGTTRSICCLVSIKNKDENNTEDRSERIILSVNSTQFINNIKSIHFDSNTNCYAIEFRISVDSMEVSKLIQSFDWVLKAYCWPLQFIPKSYLLSSPYAYQFLLTTNVKKYLVRTKDLLPLHLNTAIIKCQKEFAKNENIISILPMKGTSIAIDNIHYRWYYESTKIVKNPDCYLTVNRTKPKPRWIIGKKDNFTTREEISNIIGEKSLDVYQAIPNLITRLTGTQISANGFFSIMSDKLQYNRMIKDLSGSFHPVRNFHSIRDIHDAYIRGIFPWRGEENFGCILQHSRAKNIEDIQLLVSSEEFNEKISTEYIKLNKKKLASNEVITPSNMFNKEYAIQFETSIQVEIAAKDISLMYSDKFDIFYPGYDPILYVDIKEGYEQTYPKLPTKRFQIKYLEMLCSQYGRVIKITHLLNKDKFSGSIYSDLREGESRETLYLVEHNDTLAEYLSPESLRSMKMITTISSQLKIQENINNYYRQLLSLDFNMGKEIKTDLTGIDLETVYNIFYTSKHITEDYCNFEPIMLLFMEFRMYPPDIYSEQRGEIIKIDHLSEMWFINIVNYCTEKVIRKAFEYIDVDQETKYDRFKLICSSRQKIPKRNFIALCNGIFIDEQDVFNFCSSSMCTNNILNMLYHSNVLPKKLLTSNMKKKIHQSETDLFETDFKSMLEGLKDKTKTHIIINELFFDVSRLAVQLI